MVSIEELVTYLFEVIDPYSINQQGEDIGEKYRTGIYSENVVHLKRTEALLQRREDYDMIAVEVLPLKNYVKSAEEHQDRLDKYPDDYCHIPKDLLKKYDDWPQTPARSTLLAGVLFLCEIKIDRSGHSCYILIDRGGQLKCDRKEEASSILHFIT